MGDTVSLLDAFDAVPTRCELGDHSLCEHAGATPDMPIMTWDVPDRCKRGDHSWCPDDHAPA
jgi:hypothetical protein